MRGWLRSHGQNHQWPGLAAIGKVVRVREATDKTTTETVYYLLSAAMTPERFENQLHWCLDVVMNEDQMRNRTGHSAENLAILRHLALNLVRKENSKGSLPKKLHRAAWRNSFLAKVLAQV